MKDRIARTAAIGVLFSLAATVGLWGGALASASTALHSQAQVHAQAQPPSGGTPAAR
jgi:hypothetical protein